MRQTFQIHAVLTRLHRFSLAIVFLPHSHLDRDITLRRVRAHNVRDAQVTLTDAYQTTPLCSQISCTHYSLGANARIACSLYVFCAPIFSERNSRSRSLYVVARLSVCLSVVCNVRAPTQAIENFGSVFIPFATLATR